MTPKEELAHIDESIKVLEERRAALFAASLAAPAEEKIVDDFFAEMCADRPRHPSMFPLEIHGIAWEKGDLFYRFYKNTELVKVRPCAPEHENKTFLGLYLGDFTTGPSARFDRESGLLIIGPGMSNPAFWIPSLKKLVFGMESWWSKIETPEDLKQITDEDINSVWYVQALKAMEKT